MSQFVDEARVCVKGGDGGAGAVSMRREAHVPRGGPDGGDGGDGGSVWLVADHNVASLLAFRDHPHRRADAGRHGQGKKRHGAAGSDLVVPVPVGTVVRGADGVVVADLANDGDRWLASAGGEGGRGNARFLRNRRRAPTFAEQGEQIDECWLRLELKLFADVAIVGMPNVGKSTLISRLSAARPKIADYPFTTLEPNLGVVQQDDGRDYIVADIPGLIEGAATGRGLGHRFLRHIERARVLVLLLDLAEWDGTTIEEQERILLAELEQFRPDLVERPRLRVGSRVDLTDARPDDFLCVSGVTGEGIPELKTALGEMVAETPVAEAVQEPASRVLRPEPEGVVVGRDDDGAYRVRGRRAERAVAVSDLTNPDALDYVRERLESLGVDRALDRAGASHGDTVRIAGLEFSYDTMHE